MWLQLCSQLEVVSLILATKESNTYRNCFLEKTQKQPTRVTRTEMIPWEEDHSRISFIPLITKQ